MWTKEELKKLASLERMSIEYLDEFIDGRIQRGETGGVPLRRFNGHVSHAHECNLRDYIGRTEGQLFDFFFARPHLWTIHTADGLVGKVPSATRLLVLELAVYLHDDPRASMWKQFCDIVDGILVKWPTKSWSVGLIRDTLETHPDLFRTADEDGIIYKCRVSTVDGVILPESLLSSTNARRLEDILDKNDGDRYLSSRNAISALYGGGGDHDSMVNNYDSDRSYSSSGAAAAATASAPSKPTTKGDRGDSTARDTVDGAGRVVCVLHEYAFASVGKTKVYCHISNFDEKFEAPLSKHVCVGDELYITEAVAIRGGRYDGKWRAQRVSTKKPPPPLERDHRDRDRSTATDRHHRRTTLNRAVSPDCRPRSSSPPPIASSTKPKQSATTAINNGAGASSNSATAQVQYRTGEPMIKKEVVEEAKEAIRLVDVGVQTDVTDEELLLRLLRRFPQIIDGMSIVARQ